MQGITRRCEHVGRKLLYVEGVLSDGVQVPDVTQGKQLNTVLNPAKDVRLQTKLMLPTICDPSDAGGEHTFLTQV
jgi:hypothetical protein